MKPKKPEVKKDKELRTLLEKGGTPDAKKLFDELLRRAVKTQKESR